MGAHVSPIKAEHYWQTAGNHKSNAGDGSVLSEPSGARLLFINQDEPCLGEARLTPQHLVSPAARPDGLCLMRKPATRSIRVLSFDVPHEWVPSRLQHTLDVLMHSDGFAKSCYGFSFPADTGGYSLLVKSRKIKSS